MVGQGRDDNGDDLVVNARDNKSEKLVEKSGQKLRRLCG